ncbi:hypothetical protein B4589_001835 [Halolamina sp. CBA1230]|uniref:hypothetical protein n=1 Tax=Halolamina sp. CBA1230 TaxID=1853690 RepID=UPI0009A20B77|nr:hypothetical protein [Halolamina sp. CBA1230]QKY19178.1 hypothetical protein B4589_001835 [Halolamina sp. CBA1230]
MPTLETWSLWLHIAAGTVAVLAGVGALVTKKGGRRHRGAGKLFLAAMAVTVATVFVLLAAAVTTFRIVLTLVAVFSGYLAFSGYRVLSRKRPSETPATVDWLAAGTVVVACLVLGSWGVAWFLDGSSFGVVMAVFGGIGVAFGGQELRSFRRGESGEWLVGHLQRMIAAFIATISAVSAVNLTPVIGVSAWLWPTVVGTPLIAYWSRKYESDR